MQTIASILPNGATDPNFWVKVRTEQRFAPQLKKTLEFWDTYCHEIPNTTYREFKRFFSDGNRYDYEKKYFHRRKALAASAVLSLVYPEEEKYLSFLQDVIFAICDEYSWALPAHHETLDDLDEDRLDLFSTETGFTLAEIYTMLGDRMEPLIRARLLKEVDVRIIQSYYQKKRIYWWETRENNWSAVCAGSIGCTFLLLRPDLFPEVEARISDSMECYLSGFGEDGICVEGMGYWNYGFGFFTVYADLLRRFSHGEKDYFARPKVRTIASFPNKMCLNGDIGVSFSDGRPTFECDFSLTQFLKGEYPDETTLPKNIRYIDGCARFCLYLRSFLWALEQTPEEKNPPCEVWAQDAQWMVKRTAAYGFAAKGGNNGESHNHNDLGSFIVAKNNRQILCDLGCGEYTRQYFDDAIRYTTLCCSSRGHSVPLFGDAPQKHGEEYTADAQYTPGQLTLELGKAYDLPTLSSFRRVFRLKETEILVEDTFQTNGDLPITERFVTQIEPILVDGVVTVDGVALHPEGNSTVEIRTLEKEFRSTAGGNPHFETVYLIDYLCSPGTQCFRLQIEVK